MEAGGPLAGVRVLDLSAYLAGPYACTLLADMGADVIKVEPPEGDNSRNYPSSLASTSRSFLGINRGKRGVVIDLKSSTGLKTMLRLLAQADVMVHNFRPGVAERLGIGFTSLSAAFPRLVYCHVTGYGGSGPFKSRPGYDQVLQTYSGICSLQGGPDTPPQIVNGSVVDYYAASLAALAISGALLHRARTGKGQLVSVSLLASALAMQSARLVWAKDEPRNTPREFASGGITGLHPTKDGWLYLSANTARFWEKLCHTIGLPGLAADPRYDSIRKRAAAASELVPILREALGVRTAREWESVLALDVPAAAVRSIEDMFEDDQVDALDLIHTYTHPLVGTYRAFARPFEFSTSDGARCMAAPILGEHTDEVLREAGLDEAEIEQLRRPHSAPRREVDL